MVESASIGKLQNQFRLSRERAPAKASGTGSEMSHSPTLILF